MTQHHALDTQILQLVVAMFNATPGAAVLAELRSALTGGESVEALARNLVRTDVFKSLYPDTLDASEFSARFALNVLEAEVGPSQMAYAIRELTALQRAGLDRAQTVLRAIDALLSVAPANPEWGNARQAFDNKVTVAAYFSVEKQKSAQTLEELQSVVQPVTSNPCSVEGAISQINGLASGHVVLVVMPGLQTDTGVNSTVDAGGITRDNTVGIAGTVSDAGSVTTVEVLDGALVLGTATVAANGDWRFTTTVLADGEHALSVRTVGATCDTVSSSPIVFTVDTTAPMFAAGASTSVNVAENTATTTTVHSATASDTVAVTDYTLDASGADNARFSLNTTTGALRFLANPDFEAPGSAAGSNSYTVRIRASDAAGNSAGQTVTVNVTDVNEHAPVFTSGATGSVAENADLSTAIYTATTTDADGTLANRGVVYSLKAGGDAALLNIDSGVVTLRSSANFEARSSYSFTVLATNGSQVSEREVTVNVTDLNDNAPVFTGSATGTVAENAATTTAIYTATSTDADGTEAHRGVVYSLKAATGDVAALDIDAGSGVVTLKHSADHETKTSYSFTVVVTNGSQVSEREVTVNVTDVDEFDVASPTDANSATNTVTENAAVGTAVGITAHAADADATTNTVTYSFTTAGNPDGLFAIDRTSGVITTAKAIDRETLGASRSITVLATSEDGSTATSTFSIAINNHATETRTLSVDLINGGGTVSLVENTPTASDTAVVARLRATGEAATFAPDVLSWHLVSVNESPATDAARFTLDADGTLRFNTANFEEAFLHGRLQEGNESTDNDYTVAVVLRDIDGNQSSQIAVRVLVQDDDGERVPATQSVEATDVVTAVNEHTGSGTAAPVAVAQLTFRNAIGLAHWSLPSSATAVGFSVSATGSVAFTPPDREAAEFDGRDRNNPDDWVFSARVTGTDDDGNVMEHTVSVRLDNVVEGTGLRFNEADNPLTVAESTAEPAAPVKVLSLQGAIGTVTWELSGADKDRFRIGADGNSLNLVTSDFETGWTDGTRSAGHDADDNTYSVSVTATDREGQQVTRTLDVNVTDVTETPTGTGVAGLEHAGTMDTEGNLSVSVNITESTAPTLLGAPVFAGAIGAVTWRLLGQSDGRAADFDEEDVTFNSDGLLLLRALDFESLADKTSGSAGGSIYRVGLLGVDSDGNARQVLWTINLVDRPMAVAITAADGSVVTTTTQANGNRSSSVSVNERVADDNTPYVFNAQLDLAANFDSPTGTALVWALDTSYKDHALFTWNNAAQTLTLAAKDRENPLSTEEGNVYSVRLLATDTRGTETLQVAQHELAVTIADVVERRNLVIASNVTGLKQVYAGTQGDDAVVGVFRLADTSDAPVGKLSWEVESSNNWMFFMDLLDNNTMRLSVQYLDYGEARGQHSFTVHATDFQGNTKSLPTMNIEVLKPPFDFTNQALVQIAEGAEPSLALQLDNMPAGGVTWSVQGGSDLDNLLAAQPDASGMVWFKAQDYEHPVDDGADHTYLLTLLATSAALGFTARKVIEVRVTDAPIAIATSKGTPDLTNPAVQVLQIAENVDTSSNDAIVTTLNLRTLATDDTAAGTLRWRLEGDDAAARFQLVQDASGAGSLRLKTQNFEYDDPINPDPTADDKYEVTLVAEDMAADGTTVLQTARQNFRVEVQNVDEDDRFFFISVSGSSGDVIDASIDRNETEAIVLNLSASDFAGNWGANGVVTWLVNLTSADTSLPERAYTISGNVLTIRPLDSEAYGSVDGGKIAVTINGKDEDGTFAGFGSEFAIKNFTLQIKDVDESRTFTIQNLDSLKFDENSTSLSWVPVVMAQVPADAPPSLPAEPYSFSKVVSGDSFGADHAFFDVDRNTGAVSLNTALDREAPSDADGDSIYQLTLRVADDDGNVELHNLSIQIVGVYENAELQIQRNGAELTESMVINVDENDFFTTTLTAVATPATPSRGALHWSLVGDVPVGLEINASTGVLSWFGVTSHEATTGGSVTATVRVTDSDVGPGGLSPNEDTQTITFQVADRVAEVQIVGGYRHVVAERSDFQVAVSLVDDGSSTPRADVAWLLAGEDASDFVFDGSTLRWNTSDNGGLPDYETPKDGPTNTRGDNVYQVTLVATQTGTGAELARQFFQLSVSNLTLEGSITADENSVGIAFHTEATQVSATLSNIVISNSEEGELAWDMDRMTAAGWQLDGDSTIRRIEGTSTYGSFTFEPAAAGATTGGVITYYVNPAYAATAGYRALASGQGPTTDPVTLALVGGTSLVRGFVIEGVEDVPEISAAPGGGTASGVVATVAEDPGVRLELTAQMLVNLSGASDPDLGDRVNVFVVTEVNASFGTLLIGKSLAEATPWRAATDTDPGNCQIGRIENGDNYYIGYWLPKADVTGSLTAMRVHVLETTVPQIYNVEDPTSVTNALTALNKRSVNGFDVQVNVTAVNDAPRLSFFESEVEVEAGKSVRVSEDLLWSDVDNATPAALTVKFDSGYNSAVDSLSVADYVLEGTGLQATWNAAAGTLVIAAQAGQTPTELHWTDVLEAIQYTHAGTSDTRTTLELQFRLQDPGGLTDTAGLTLAFTAPAPPSPVPTSAGQGSLQSVMAAPLVQLAGVPPALALGDLSV